METWLEINLNRLEENYNYIKSISGGKICSVIKADAYGLGSTEISKKLEKLGTELFAVAFVREALELRKVGVKKDIIIFNYVSPKDISVIKKENFILTLYSLEQLKYLIAGAKGTLEGTRVHMKVNTGMNRLGFDKFEYDAGLKLIEQNRISLEGIYSHFAAAEDDIEFTKTQNSRFIEAYKYIEAKLGKKIKKHISNSPATVNYDYNYDYVRVGMMLYGLQPLDNFNKNLKPIFTWKSLISNVREVKKGSRISYGKTTIDRDMLIGLVPVGYAHGYIRQLSNKGYVYVKNKKCPIIGDICMDQMIIDLSELGSVEIGVEVELLGENIRLEELAGRSDTIGDDMVCKVFNSISRTYVDRYLVR